MDEAKKTAPKKGTKYVNLEPKLNTVGVPDRLREAIDRSKRTPMFLTRDDGTGPKTKTGKSEKTALAKILVKAHNAFNKRPTGYERGSDTFTRHDGTVEKRRTTLTTKHRLGKNNPNAHLYKSGGPLSRRAGHRDIKAQHAKHQDLYIYSRWG